MKTLITALMAIVISTSTAFADSPETKPNPLLEVQSLAECYGTLATFQEYSFELELIGSEYADTQKLEELTVSVMYTAQSLENEILSNYPETKHQQILTSLKRTAQNASIVASTHTSMGFNQGAEYHAWHAENSINRYCAGVID